MSNENEGNAAAAIPEADDAKVPGTEENAGPSEENKTAEKAVVVKTEPADDNAEEAKNVLDEIDNLLDDDEFIKSLNVLDVWEGEDESRKELCKVDNHQEGPK